MKFEYLLKYYLIILFMPACINTKKAVYFNNLGDSEFLRKTESLEPVISENDLLSISVSSLNPEASQIFNTPNISATQTSTATGSTTQASGYLVDQEGFIQFPFLGSIKAAGLTKKDLKESISKELISKKLLLDPIVNIRYLNYKVSVIGEVANPSVITIPNEKVTLLEAIALAGDLTIYAKRDRVWLIREVEGKRTLTKLDLSTNQIFTSPYYNLKSNDLIYVEPNKSRIASASRVNQLGPLILSALSVIIITVTTLAR